MKKLLLSLTILFLFAGCAKDGMAINTIGKNNVSRVFKEGIVLEQKKVIIDDKETAILTGAAAGVLGGQMIKGNTQSTLIGLAIGTITGVIMGNEIEAYETKIKSSDKSYTAYLKQKLKNGTKIEFTLKDGKIKNLNIL